MNGLNAANVAVGGMPAMNNGANGAAARILSDQEREIDYKARLNTYIYDYLLKNEQYDCARQLLKSTLTISTSKIGQGGRRPNGVDEGSLDADSKEDLDSKRPHDLPAAENFDGMENSSFLLEWFSTFWDMFWAQKGNKSRSGQQALSYMQHTQVSPNTRRTDNTTKRWTTTATIQIAPRATESISTKSTSRHESSRAAKLSAHAVTGRWYANECQ